MHTTQATIGTLVHTTDYNLVEKVAQEIRDLNAANGKRLPMIGALISDYSRDNYKLDKLEEQLLALVVGTDQVMPTANGTAVSPIAYEVRSFPLGFQSRLVFDSEIHDVYPVVVGTQLTTNQIVRLVLDGSTWQQILTWYPELSEDGIRASLEYSALEK